MCLHSLLLYKNKAFIHHPLSLKARLMCQPRTPGSGPFLLEQDFFFTGIVWIQMSNCKYFVVRVLLVVTIFKLTIHCQCLSPIKLEQGFSFNFICVTHYLLLPDIVLNMVHWALICPGGHAVTFSITCSLLGKLPGVCGHAVGRANPVMTETVNWLQSDLYPRLSCKVEIMACEERSLTFSQWID